MLVAGSSSAQSYSSLRAPVSFTNETLAVSTSNTGHANKASVGWVSAVPKSGSVFEGFGDASKFASADAPRLKVWFVLFIVPIAPYFG
jgi:hypothetical protein